MDILYVFKKIVRSAQHRPRPITFLQKSNVIMRNIKKRKRKPERKIMKRNCEMFILC